MTKSARTLAIECRSKKQMVVSSFFLQIQAVSPKPVFPDPTRDPKRKKDKWSIAPVYSFAWLIVRHP